MIKHTRRVKLFGPGESVIVEYVIPRGDLSAQIRHKLYLAAKLGNPYVGPDGKELPSDKIDEEKALSYIKANQAFHVDIAGMIEYKVVSGEIEGDLSEYDDYMVALGKHIEDVVVNAIMSTTLIPPDKAPVPEQAPEDLAQDPTR